MQYFFFFGGPNWQVNKQNMAPAYFVCVCGLCGTGISFSGASNISAFAIICIIISMLLKQH